MTATYLDRKAFYDHIRGALFNDSINAEQFDGIQAVLNEWEKRSLKDLRWLAYMLATDYWETDKTMQPIREYGRGKGKKYGTTYYGRGLVQLTWKENYEVMGKLLGLPLVSKPDLALDMAIAVQILFEGMLRAESGVGDFTRKSLDMYFNETTEDWINARRVINGVDKANTIASIAKKFNEALKQSVREKAPPEPLTPVKEVEEVKPVTTETATPTVVVGGSAAVVVTTVVVVGKELGWWDWIVSLWPF